MLKRLTRDSVRWRAALLTSALVALALALFAAFAFRQLSADVTARAKERASVTAALIAGQAANSAQATTRLVERIAARPALRACLAAPDPVSACASALGDLPAMGEQTAVLFDRTGRVLATATTPIGAKPIETATAPPGAPGIEPLTARGGRAYTRTVAAMFDADGRTPMGSLALARAIDTGGASTLLTGFIGQDARAFVGNARGDVWTDLRRAVEMPPFDVAGGSREFTAPDGETMIGAPAPVAGTPWMMVVAFPRATLMAPVWHLVRQFVAASLVLIMLVVGGAAVLSARVTRPLTDLTEAAQALAGGDYARRVRSGGPDEVGRLAEAFNAMAGQIGQSRAALEAHARDLEASREEARHANQSKDEFLAVLSHELRTPLNAMLGWCQLLRSGHLPADRLGQALDVIDRNARAQLRLVEDLLDVSSIVSGRFALEFRPTDPAAVVQAAADAIQPAATAKGLQLEVAIDPVARRVNGDAGRLQQAVGNLLSNALKFTPSGGRISVSMSTAGDGVEIAVRDTGEGLSPEALPHIFDRLGHGHTARARDRSGLGLGLAIVRHVVERHGGHVRAESRQPAAAATFRIWLPCAVSAERTAGLAPAPAAGRAAERTVAAAVHGLRVLVVDDSEDAREVARALLTLRGVAVTTAATVADAFTAIDRELPDLVLSDLEMPSESGFDLIARLRARPSAQGGTLPAVALTAYAARQDRSRSIAAGFDAHMTKPIDGDALVDLVARLARPLDQALVGP